MTRTHSNAGAVVVRVVLAVLGIVIGGVLALVLPFVLWPGGVAAALGIPSRPASPDAILSAELTYGLVLGAVGAVLPASAYRIGYAVVVLLIVMAGSASYWSRHDAGLPLLVGVAAWLVVAGTIRLIQVFTSPRA